MLDWVNATPLVKRWYDRLTGRSKSTAKSFVNALYQYWCDHLSKRLPSIEAWVAEVIKQSFSRDLEAKRQWALELKSYYLYRKIKRSTRLMAIASVKSFFKDKVELSAVHDFNLGSNEEIVAESEQRQELKPLAKDEVKTVISHRPSPLYKAIFLTQLSGGIAVIEMV